MDINTMVESLLAIRRKHGNLPIVGGWMVDDKPPNRIIVIDVRGGEVTDTNGLKPHGIYIEG